MAKPKKYQIDSFEKLLNVINNDNAENLCKDLTKWLLFCNRFFTKYREQYPEETKGKLNSEIAKCSFVWIDDGKNGFEGLEVLNTDTGEVTKIKNGSNHNPKV